MCPPSWTLSHVPPHPIPQGHPSALAMSTLSHASNLDWWSISHMVIYRFQCYSLKSSHPCLFPQSPTVCSLHLCLFCCLTYRVIIIIFLNSVCIYWVQFSSVAQSCLTLCDPMNRSTPGLPVHHQLLEFSQTHVHWVGNAIQPSHPLSSPSPPALNLSQHQGLFQWVRSSHQVAKALASLLPMNIQGWSPLGLTSLISLQSKGLSRVFSSTTVKKHQLFGTQHSLWANYHIHTWLL